MRIVILDGYTLSQGKAVWGSIASQGELTVYDRTTREQLLERAKGAEVLLTNKTPLRQDVLEQLPALKYIAVMATGYNVVDVDAARRRDIPVSNVPEYGTDSVAQFTIALLFELCHHVGDHDRAVKAGEWTNAADWCFWKHSLTELSGLKLGIVGYGRIGRKVGEIARALGMEIVTASRSQKESIPSIFEKADVVSLHCPETPETKGFVTADLLRRMKKTAFLLNTSRGSLIDEKALAEALNQGVIAGAALDVVSQEPIRADNPLLKAKNCILTPHLAWATEAARGRLIAETAGNLAAYRQGRPRNVVNANR